MYKAGKASNHKVSPETAHKEVLRMIEAARSWQFAMDFTVARVKSFFSARAQAEKKKGGPLDDDADVEVPDVVEEEVEGGE